MTISFVTNEFNNTLNSFLLKHYNTTSTMKSSKSLHNCIYWNIGTIDSITIALLDSLMNAYNLPNMQSSMLQIQT